MQGPQGGGDPNQRVPRRRTCSLDKIGNGNTILEAGVPDKRRQAGIGRGSHAGEVACRITRTRINPQQVCRSSDDAPRGPVRAGRSVRSRMSSNSVAPKASFRPRVTTARFSCGIIRLRVVLNCCTRIELNDDGRPTAAQESRLVLSDITGVQGPQASLDTSFAAPLSRLFSAP